MELPAAISAVIGLGNPGKKYYNNRHNIGFRIVDVLAQRYSGTWQSKDIMEMAEIIIEEYRITLIKPQTFMNVSGKVIPLLLKKGIKLENILVIHDELEHKFGKLSIKFGGSARGHNGLRSIINVCGKDFVRFCFGIGRPEQKKDVGNYVLSPFNESQNEVEQLIEQSVDMIEELYKEKSF